ncbi:MAG: hypothetical protein AVDCRST_MAG96-1834 [uncultured Segetibacter sp.]|uniref:Uncharacterized protein n=1 Tax=uncultured Segetibacter sp. TaxID=481133 RepID=A0A6J4SFJ6_9BACT|nr:MAG: hypothetical protein AVDCRST_MAG96-1834 [uncultured Segetibacter sp.]
MFNSFSILYQTYLTQNLFLTSSHQTPVSFFKTCFWLYGSFICSHFQTDFKNIFPILLSHYTLCTCITQAAFMEPLVRKQ